MTTKLIYRSRSLSNITLSGIREFEQTNLADALFGQAPGKSDYPKVVCLNVTEGSD